MKTRLMAGDKTRGPPAQRLPPRRRGCRFGSRQHPAEPVPSLKHMDFRVWYYDKADLMALREFLQARGLRFGKVPVMGSPKQ